MECGTGVDGGHVVIQMPVSHGDAGEGYEINGPPATTLPALPIHVREMCSKNCLMRSMHHALCENDLVALSQRTDHTCSEGRGGGGRVCAREKERVHVRQKTERKREHCVTTMQSVQPYRNLTSLDCC